jgi:Predicted ATPase
MKKVLNEIQKEIIETIEKAEEVVRVEKLKTNLNLNQDYPLIKKINEEEEKKMKYDTGVLANYVIMAEFEGKYIYKDYADTRDFDSIFYLNNGCIRIYNEELGVYEQLTNERIRRIIEDYFFRKPYMYTDHKSGKKPFKTFLDDMVEDVKNNLNMFLRKQKMYWNDSFKKDFLAIAFKNGTFIFNMQEKKVYFKSIKSPQFLTSYYFNIDYKEEFLNVSKNIEKNNLMNFLNFKLNLIEEKKKMHFYACFFDLFYTENPSQHAIYFTGDAKSGKSTFLLSIFNISNSQNWLTNKNIIDLVDKFTVPEDFQRNIIMSDETKEKYLEDCYNLKSLLSKGYITTERKFKDRITVKVFSKVIGVGEKPLENKVDGGMDRRFLYFKFSNKRIELKEKLEDYLKKDIEKNLFQALLIGFYSVIANNYFETLTSLRDEYEILYPEVILSVAKAQTSYIEKMEEIFTFDEKSCIQLTDLMNIYFAIFNKDKGNTQRTFREYIENLIKKSEDFKSCKIVRITTNVTVKKIDKFQKYSQYPKLNENETFETKNIFKRNNSYITGININRDTLLKKLALINNKNIEGENTVDKANNIESFFRRLPENEYNYLIEHTKED